MTYHILGTGKLFTRSLSQTRDQFESIWVVTAYQAGSLSRQLQTSVRGEIHRPRCSGATALRRNDSEMQNEVII